MLRKRDFLLALIIAGVLALSGCVAPSGPVPPSAPDEPDTVSVTLGLGYIPSVQFAPFYVAATKGFFEEQGLDVSFQHGSETDFLKLVGADQMQFVVASGEQVILARAQELPVTYVAAWYRQFPVVVFAPEEAGLDQPAALAGKRVGIPGLFGASLVGWKALVYATGIDETQVTLESIGFTQAAAVSEGRVDAAIDYVVNGPEQLAEAGRPVDIIAVGDYIDLPANGLVTNDQTIAGQPELVQAMTTAMLKGIQYTLANPDEAFAISLDYVPEAAGENEPINRRIFDRSLDLWQVAPAEIGRSDAEAWQQAADFMLAMGLLDAPVAVEGIFSNRFADAAALR